MHYVRFGNKGIIPIVSLLIFCWVCMAPGPAVSSANPPQGEESVQSGAAPAAPVSARADRIRSVSVKDSALQTVLKIAGNGSLRDYQLRKLGDNRFMLELGSIDAQAPLPMLPVNSNHVKLAYVEPTGQEVVKIIGTLKNPLNSYTVDPSEDGLLVTLNFGKGKIAPGEGAALSSQPAQAAAGGVKGRKGATMQVAGVPAQRGYQPETPIPDYTNRLSQPPELQVAMARRQYTGKPISLDLLDADLRNVLRLLADLTGTNIVIEPDVNGKVTLKVEQVPWDQVLDMVISMNDLGKEQIGSVIRIAKQAKLKNEWAQQADAIKARQDLVETTKDLGELSTVYLSVSYAQPADMATKINEMKSDKGKVSVDERSSLIIYTDYPARVAGARQLLSRLDRPTAQVLIESRIITLNTDVARNLGVHLGFKSTSPIPSGSTSGQEFEINSPTATLFTMGTAAIVGATLLNVDLTIEALETADELRVMAAPRVMTMNNVKAVISQGVNIPYLQVGDTASNITGTAFVAAVLELQVTPHITPDRKVRMTIDAKQDEPSTTVTGANDQPGIDTRKISTELTIDDGNIVVIGGIIRNSDSYTRSSTPGLSDVPILGRLFKSEETKAARNELLIFISPKIVEISKPPDRT